jgi:GcrA cell cycle regulator
MSSNASTWTTERLERLKIGFEAGWSCREIAVDIGVSRNAVIGKLSRLNLTREANGEARPPARKKDATERTRREPRPRQQYRLLQALYDDGSQPVPVDDPIPGAHCCSLFELTEARCRWPINTPGADDFCFCGNTPAAGLPYCPGHSRLAYRPGSRQRVAQG